MLHIVTLIITPRWLRCRYVTYWRHYAITRITMMALMAERRDIVTARDGYCLRYAIVEREELRW